MVKLASIGELLLKLSVWTIVFLAVFVIVDMIYSNIRDKKRIKRYPEIDKFQLYVAELKRKIQAESSYYFLKTFLPIIDNIYHDYNNKVPDDMLKSELREIRALYHSRREHLAPKIITQ